MSMDRLRIDEHGASTEEIDTPAEIPDEELLRLDDGTPLPPELSELRALLELHTSFASEEASSADTSDDPEHAAQLAAIASAKINMLRDSLLAFDEGLLLLHDKLLDHERLVRQLAAVRQQSKAAMPAGKVAFDEAIELNDAAAEDDAIGLNDLLAAEAPGGAGAGDCAPQSSHSAPNSSGGASGAADDEEEDEETLEQRVTTSRQQIKAWVRALQEGKQHQCHSGAASGSRPPLPPVRPPVKARGGASYSMRLRERTATWAARELR